MLGEIPSLSFQNILIIDGYYDEYVPASSFVPSVYFADANPIEVQPALHPDITTVMPHQMRSNVWESVKNCFCSFGTSNFDSSIELDNVVSPVISHSILG